MKLEFRGHDERYTVEQSLLNLFPGELPVYEPVRPVREESWAIARALVGEPALLLADEPTGALDYTSGQEVLKLFGALHDMGHTIVMITHDLNVAKAAGRIVHIIDGVLSEADASP